MTQTARPPTPDAAQSRRLDTADTRPVRERVVIKAAGLTKVFKDFWLRDRVRAVDNVDFEVHRGEVFGLLGPNGSGKSTAIKMILGLLHPTKGRVFAFGRLPEDVEAKKLIGYLPEESYLYRFLNARETLDYYGRLFHQSGVQRRNRIETLLEMVGLEAVQRRLVGEYSKGMQRRIGLAQALINDPQLLILDEPTTGMDPLGTRQIKNLILRLKERGKTILLCSHLLADVEDVCDRVAIMYGGKIRAMGPIDDLLVQEDATTIHAPELSDEEVEKIDQLLAESGKHLQRVEKPRQRLEAKFLQIVEQAQKEGLATSGARAGGRIAGFLAGEQSTQKPDTGRTVLDHLVREDQPAAKTQAAEASEAGGGVDTERANKQRALEALTESEPPAQQDTGHEHTEPEPEREQTADKDVLNNLVGDEKK